MLDISQKVWDVWELLSNKYDIDIHIGGFKPLIHFSFVENHSVNIAYFTQEMLKKGFLAGSGFYAMYAHKDEDVKEYYKAADEVFAKLSKLMQNNEVERHLEGLPATSGFARIN